MRYRVSHTTTYSYDDDVSSSFGLAHCRPRELPWQHVASRTVSIDPLPSDITDDTDCYGNVVSYFHVTEPHMRLTIDALSDVTVVPTEYDADALLEPWERARPILNPGISRGAWAATEFAMESPKALHVDAARGVRRGIPHPGASDRRSGDRPDAPDQDRLPLRQDRDHGHLHGRGCDREAGGRLPGLRAPRAGVPAQPRHGGPVRERLPRDATDPGQAAAGRRRRVARVGRGLDSGLGPVARVRSRRTTSGRRTGT